MRRAGAFAWAALAGALAGGCGGAAAERPEPAGMVDVAAARGLVHPVYSGAAEKRFVRETVGQGACWIDFDGDRDLDLFLPSGARGYREAYAAGDPLLVPWRFYVNQDGRFVERAAELGVTGGDWGVGCAVGDVDGDGHDDLYVTTATGPNRLFRNVGGRRFADVTAASGAGAAAFSTGAVFADLDGDADLDLFVATYLDESRPPAGPCRWKGAPVVCGPKGFPALEDLLFLNDGGGVFSAAPAGSGLDGLRGYGLAVLAVDAEGDGDTDLFVANDSSPNRLFVNRGDATFEEAGLIAGVALSDAGRSQAGMGVDAGDLDGDGLSELVVTNFSDDVHNLYRQLRPGLFVDRSAQSGLAQASFSRLGWSVVLEDFDLDGDLDVFLANGHVYPEVESFDGNTSYRQPLQLLWNDGGGRLREEPSRLGAAFSRPLLARGAAPADFDGDGDVDLLVVRDGEPPLLLENRLASGAGGWLKLRLEGGARGNRAGIGAQVEVVTAGRRQRREMRRTRGYLSGAPAELTFGLADEPIESVRVSWPGGGEELCAGPLAQGSWLIRQGAGCVDDGGPPGVS